MKSIDNIFLFFSLIGVILSFSVVSAEVYNIKGTWTGNSNGGISKDNGFFDSKCSIDIKEVNFGAFVGSLYYEFDGVEKTENFVGTIDPQDDFTHIFFAGHDGGIGIGIIYSSFQQSTVLSIKNNA